MYVGALLRCSSFHRLCKSPNLATKHKHRAALTLKHLPRAHSCILLPLPSLGTVFTRHIPAILSPPIRSQLASRSFSAQQWSQYGASVRGARPFVTCVLCSLELWGRSCRVPVSNSLFVLRFLFLPSSSFKSAVKGNALSGHMFPIYTYRRSRQNASNVYTER